MNAPTVRYQRTLRAKVAQRAAPGFTLIELLTALLILSLLGLMSYRGLSAVIDAREHVTQETAKWRAVAAFFSRFERDLKLAAPRPVRSASKSEPAFRGRRAANAALIELTRSGSSDDAEPPRRVGYAINARDEIELWLWPALDTARELEPERHRVLSGVRQIDVQYLAADLAWIDDWSGTRPERPLPLAVRIRLVLASGEEIVRVFSLA
jgi:general secretion pathway protein J